MPLSPSIPAPEPVQGAVPCRPKGIFILDAASLDVIYGPRERAELERLAEITGPAQTPQSIRNNLSLLADAEVIFTGWGAPVMDAAFLEAAPKLKAVFYGAGSIRGVVTPAFWERRITITSAYSINAIPVAEYTLGVILLSLKKFWSFAAGTRAGLGWDDHTRKVPGCFRSTVGLVSFGMVARRTLELLRPFDLHCLVSCPFLGEAEAETLGIELRALPQLFREADVVSLHTPDLPETRGMIRGSHFASMKTNATFINTARGAVVREQEMADTLRKRPDLTAVLDVCHPEPPAPGSPLLTLPNIVLTPHIAGSMATECHRLGEFMAREFRRYLAGEPLVGQITAEMASKIA